MDKEERDKEREIVATNRLLGLIQGTTPPVAKAERKKVAPSLARSRDELRGDVSGLAQIKSGIAQTASKPLRQEIMPLAKERGTVSKRPVSQVDIRRLAQIKDKVKDEVRVKEEVSRKEIDSPHLVAQLKPDQSTRLKVKPVLKVKAEVSRKEINSPHLVAQLKPEQSPMLKPVLPALKVKDEVSRKEIDSPHLVAQLKPEQKPRLAEKRVVITETPPLYLGVREKRRTLGTLFSKNMVGLDIGSHTIKSVQLEKSPSGLRLVSLAAVEIASSNPKLPEYKQAKLISVQKALKNIKLKQVKVVGAVGDSGVTIRQLQFPQMSEEELASSIKWESKRCIPYNIHEVEFDFQVLNSNNGNLDVLLVIVPKDLVNGYNDLLRQIQLKPIITDVGPLALMNSVLANVDMVKDEAAILLDIGAETTTLNIYSELAEYFVHYVPVSGNSFTQEIQQRFQLGYFEAEELKKKEQEVIKVIKPALDRMVYDIRKTLTFYKNQTPIKDFSQIILSGGNACIPGLDQHLADELNLRVEILNPFRNIIVDEGVFPRETLKGISCQLALAVGLAIRGYK